jgi:hypothetical protein
MYRNKTEKSFSNLAASQFCFSRSNKSTTPLQFLFLQGCVIVALQDSVIVALRDCCVARLRYCCVARLRDCCVEGCVIVALQGELLLRYNVALLLFCKVA